mmetsp:Transcript_17318/g.43051  ORF Transcript_17318/g.43051 Transcript_17318/m.43051 type:complete len:969 (-) Transcript_17318:335-3241(-)|eukprot:CAMPEP_0178992580 /NCGR_PEP_ID=MMETSP0795-20121207/6194_1 /TAXON_ID=88552 /ORGANISM="Amoebophrya sp., Strain Ameob2" /LENGTH=968 /DNA_ID=CAMNT_0020684479 /DNA_START=361 /DNA_END=3267 /DNA_ORIENTATION=-
MEQSAFATDGAAGPKHRALNRTSVGHINDELKEYSEPFSTAIDDEERSTVDCTPCSSKEPYYPEPAASVALDERSEDEEEELHSLVTKMEPTLRRRRLQGTRAAQGVRDPEAPGVLVGMSASASSSSSFRGGGKMEVPQIQAEVTDSVNDRERSPSPTPPRSVVIDATGGSPTSKVSASSSSLEEDENRQDALHQKAARRGLSDSLRSAGGGAAQIGGLERHMVEHEGPLTLTGEGVQLQASARRSWWDRTYNDYAARYLRPADDHADSPVGIFDPTLVREEGAGVFSSGYQSGDDSEIHTPLDTPRRADVLEVEQLNSGSGTSAASSSSPPSSASDPKLAGKRRRLFSTFCGKSGRARSPSGRRRDKHRALNIVRRHLVPRTLNAAWGHFPDYVAFWCVELAYERGQIRVGLTLAIVAAFSQLFLNCSYLTIACFFVFWFGCLTVWNGFVRFVNPGKVKLALQRLFQEEKLSILDILVRRLKRGDLQYHVKRLAILVNLSLDAEEAQQVLEGCHPTFIKFVSMSPQRFLKYIFRKYFAGIEYSWTGDGGVFRRKDVIKDEEGREVENHDSASAEHATSAIQDQAEAAFGGSSGPCGGATTGESASSPRREEDDHHDHHASSSTMINDSAAAAGDQSASFGGMLLHVVDRINSPAMTEIGSPGDTVSCPASPDRDRSGWVSSSLPFEKQTPAGSLGLGPGSSSRFAGNRIRPPSGAGGVAASPSTRSRARVGGGGDTNTRSRSGTSTRGSPSRAHAAVAGAAPGVATPRRQLDRYGRPRIVPILQELVKKRLLSSFFQFFTAMLRTMQAVSKAELAESVCRNKQFYSLWVAVFVGRKLIREAVSLVARALVGTGISASLAAPAATAASGSGSVDAAAGFSSPQLAALNSLPAVLKQVRIVLGKLLRDGVSSMVVAVVGVYLLKWKKGSIGRGIETGRRREDRPVGAGSDPVAAEQPSPQASDEVGTTR